MKLELKHIAPYLPYGLEVNYKEDSTSNKRINANLYGVTMSEIETMYKRKRKGISGDIIGWKGHNDATILDIKPILRPLSDLTEEIEHNGEKFVPMDWLYNKYSCLYDWEHYEMCLRQLIDFEFLPYEIVKQLLEWHFDINGLIEKGLAISK